MIEYSAAAEGVAEVDATDDASPIPIPLFKPSKGDK